MFSERDEERERGGKTHCHTYLVYLRLCVNAFLRDVAPIPGFTGNPRASFDVTPPSRSRQERPRHGNQQPQRQAHAHINNQNRTPATSSFRMACSIPLHGRVIYIVNISSAVSSVRKETHHPVLRWASSPTCRYHCPPLAHPKVCAKQTKPSLKRADHRPSPPPFHF